MADAPPDLDGSLARSPPGGATPLVPARVGRRPLFVEHDVPCINCDYNLRTLRIAGLCPECGRPVRDSTRSRRLRHADPEWLQSLFVGMWLLRAAAVLVFIGLVLGFVAMSLAHGSRATQVDWRGAVAVEVPIALTAAAFAFFGIVLLTRPEPDWSRRERWLCARRVLRIALFAGLPAAIFTFSAMGGPCVLVPLAVVLLQAVFLHTADLAERIPDADRRRTYRLMFVVLLVSIPGVALIGSEILAFFGAGDGSIVLALSVPAAVLSLYASDVVRQLGRQLRIARAHARVRERVARRRAEGMLENAIG